MGFIWEKNKNKTIKKIKNKEQAKKQNIMEYVRKERHNDNSSGDQNEEDEESMIGFHRQERKKHLSIKRGKYSTQIYKKVKNLNTKYIMGKIIRILQIMCLLGIIYFLASKL